MKVNPAANTKRGQERISSQFIHFIMNVELGVNYHGFNKLKPIELEPVLDEAKQPIEDEYLLHNYCALKINQKLSYLEAFIVNIGNKLLWNIAFIMI